jgi:hypothetical protein
MPFQESEAQIQLINSVRAHAGDLVQAFARAADEREPVAAACDRASRALDRYCCDLLDQMLASTSPLSCADGAWLRSKYLTLIVEFGSAIRDAIKDSETRHAAAQVLQYRVLEHERHLRLALESAAAAHSPVVDINPGTAADPSLTSGSTYLARPDITRERV